MIIERRTGEKVDIMAFRRKGDRTEYLIRFADGSMMWRDSNYIQIGLSPEKIVQLKENAAELVAEILSQFRIPFFTRIVTTSMRDLPDRIIFNVRIEFWAAGSGRSSVEIPVVFDKEKSVFYKPEGLYWNGQFHRISQEIFDRFFRKVPRGLCMNIFSPHAPLQVEVIEKLL